MTVRNIKSANVSIVIPTRNRPYDLKKLLNSIRVQTILPKEIIIIDDSCDEKTKDLVYSFKNRFSAEGISLKYLRGGERSVAQKRNIGAFQSTEEICFFIDDDMILDRDYIKKVLEVYEKHPDALGVAGYIINLRPVFSLKGKLSNILGRILLVYHFTPDACKAKPIGISYPFPLTKIISCEWLNAGSVSYRKKVFKEFRWDENLRTYSISEDKDLSYQIYKRYPNSLYMTPYAKIFHAESPTARFPKKYVIYMGVAHSVYIFYKNFKQTLINNITFMWGLFFGHFIHQILTRNPYNVIFQIGAYLNLFKNFKQIKKGDFSSLKNVK
jgi:glycosyltransferase involved in cell wall biosynthesis